MTEYQDVLVLWLNGNNKGPYYSLKNVSGEQVVIEPGEQMYLRPSKTPVASISMKVESESQADNTNNEVDPNDIPF